MYRPPGLIKIVDNYTPKQKNNTKDDDYKKLFPKCLVALFLTLNCIWGLDFGFAKYFNKKNQTTMQFITFLVNIITIAILSQPVLYLTLEPVIAVWQLSFLFQYVVVLFILNCTKYKLYDFLIDLKKKAKESAKMSNFCAFLLIFYISGTQFIKYVLFLFPFTIDEVAYLNSFQVLPCEISAICYIATDFVPFVLIVIYYYVFLYLKNLRESVHKITFKINIVVEQYDAVSDCYEKIMTLYDRVVSIYRKSITSLSHSLHQ